MIRWLFRLTEVVGAAIWSRRLVPESACWAPKPRVRIEAVPATPSLLAEFTSASVMTPAAIWGDAAVPARSPASWTIPLVEVVASGGVPPEAATQTDPFQYQSVLSAVL